MLGSEVSASPPPSSIGRGEREKGGRVHFAKNRVRSRRGGGGLF